jgi:hypothetical protein
MAKLAGFRLAAGFAALSFAKTLVVTDDPAFTVAKSVFATGLLLSFNGSLTVMTSGTVGQFVV